MCRFAEDRNGATAVMFGLMLLPLLTAAGASIDYAMLTRANDRLQAVADEGGLAAATSPFESESELRAVAERYIRTNWDDAVADDLRIDSFSFENGEKIKIEASADVSTFFLGLAGFDRIRTSISAEVVKGYPGALEVALVLDNTWSMSDYDENGRKKIDALKEAAEVLVETLLEDEKADIRISLVPYADYVNVGKDNRGQPWISVPADTATTTPRTCETRTTKQQCTTTKGPPKTCKRTVDGVVETYDCTQSTTTCQTVQVAPYQYCTGGGTSYSRWYGCVGSRTAGTLRLTDAQPSTPYPGYLASSQNCLNPVVPLTSNKSTLISAVRGMIINIGGYKPATYIPAGLIWGINVLSPSAPFTEGKDYDPANKRPRKVIVLMTDGENTLRFQSTDGKHVALNSNSTTAQKQVQQTNKDTTALCDYAKQKNIELFAVAFAVPNNQARKLLEECATTVVHYYEASDAAALFQAFGKITDALKEIRLAK